MTSKLIETLGEKLGEQWIALSVTPAFIFWTGGLFLWIQNQITNGGPLEPVEQFAQLAAHEQVALVLCIVLVITASAAIVKGLGLFILRGLEGYWPGILRSLENAFRSRKEKRWEEWHKRYQELSGKSNGGQLRSGLTDAENDEYDQLVQDKVRWMPAKKEQIMPTFLGNILRTAERRPEVKYGLDAIICWPRLWLLLPSDARNELIASRERLDALAGLWLWGILFLVWTIYTPWALLSVLIPIIAYYYMLQSAKRYGELIEAAFDVYRTSLYTSLRLPLPNNPGDEFEKGQQLTNYLWYGPVQDAGLVYKS